MGALLLAALLCAGSVSAQGQACWRQEPVLTDSAVGKAAVEGQGLTITPSEAFLGKRTRVFPFTCRIEEGTDFEVASFGGIPGIYNGVTRQPGEIFLLAGVINGDEPIDGAVIYGFNTSGGGIQQTWSTQLINTTEVDEWNYPGVMALDSQGRLVVVYGYHLAALDASTGEVLQGFAAFTACPLYEGNSTMVLVDGDSLEVKQVLELPGAFGGRISSGIYEGTEYIYLTGTGGSALRWVYGNGEVVQDDSWQGEYKLNKLSTPASSLAMIGDWVVTMTNGLQSLTPMFMTAISQKDASITHSVTPFEATLRELNGSIAENIKAKTIVSWGVSAISADPENMMVYPFDFVAGRVAGYRLSAKGFEKAWEEPQRTANFMQLLGGSKDRMLVGTNVPGLPALPTMEELTTYTEEYLQFRDAASGRLLAETPDLGAARGLPSAPGFGNEYFYWTANTLNKLTYKLAAKPADEGGASAAPAPAPAATPASAGTVARGQEAAVTLALAGAALALLL
ncbi:hypothetical protein COHA_004390 [Chlorella ohadii]|uniref:Uncharacterized protein n=1 Tax=Chlorella ohadii TaxID=2649997 RepID=A0AAD5DT93_9CHLO|nr:hypothetical protein COHA_004390 [Chlorella ohadii]